MSTEAEFVQAFNAMRLGVAERRARLAAEAARSRRTDAELLRVAVGSRPDLGADVAHAAGALVAARHGALADWTDEACARAVVLLDEVVPPAATALAPVAERAVGAGVGQ